MPQNILRLRRAAWTALLLLGSTQGWMFRHVISPDGVAYLDLSDSIADGRPQDLINGYWSPLYPALIGLLRLVVSRTPFGAPYWEFALVHVVSFLGFALSLAAFEWLLCTLDDAGIHWNNGQPFQTTRARAAAYLLFGVTSLGMISVAGTVPDFFLAAAMFGAVACVLRLHHDPDDARTSRRLGLTLGVAALTKSFAFPLSAIVLTTLGIANARRGGVRTILRAAVVFVAVTAPWVIALSLELGHFSVGRTGALNYAWYVNEQQSPNTGAVPALAIARGPLPVKRVAVLDGARGTNPLWYDPTRWHADLRIRFSPEQQWSRLSHSLRYYVYLGAPLLLAILSIAAAATRRDLAVTLERSWVVLVPCLAALGAYALVYTVSRLIAPFVAAICLVLAAAFPRDAMLRALPFSVALGLSLVGIHGATPTGLRSMVIVTYGLALFTVAWTLTADRHRALQWTAALLAVAALWLLPVPSGTEAAAMAGAIAVAMYLVLRRGTAGEQGARRVRERQTRELLAARARRIRELLAVGAVVALAVPSFAFAFAALVRGAGEGPPGGAHSDWSAAQRMIAGGVAPGSRIVLLGTPRNWGWARLARYQFVGIIPDEEVDAFLRLNDPERAVVMRAFSGSGGTPIVLRPGP